MIPPDRWLLVVSMVLQSAVSLIFGLAFLGLWKGFHRPTAIRWAVAWLVYAAGVIFAALGIGLGFGEGFSPVGRALLVLPIQFGVVLFRAGTDSLVEREDLKVTRYVMAGVIIFGIFVVLREVEASRIIPIRRELASYILPRILMGMSYAWAVWPLRTLARRRWAEGYALMAGALVCLSTRMFVSAGYEIWQIRHASSPESAVLTIAQLCFLIAFGVSTALVLVEAERVAAVEAAQTIRESADALRASEARYRFVVEHTSDVQAIVGHDQRVRYIAPSCERLIGLSPSAFEGRIILDLIHPDDREHAQKSLARMQADPSGRRPPTSVRIQNRSGEWLPFDVTGQLVPQEGADGPTMVLSIRDMTAQRKLEAALLQTSRMDSLGRMAGSVAHDFNNVLTVIEGGLYLMMREIPLDSPVRRDLVNVGAAARQGVALTRQLLTFARQRPPNSEQFDVRDRLASLEGVVAMAVGRTVVVRIAGGDRALLVRADPGQFDQVIINLAINAHDAMPSGGTLTIQSTVETAIGMGEAIEPGAATAWARVTVEDTGDGIPAANLDRIFEPFFTTKAEGRGTGLGLASAYGFVRQAGGRLTVESTEGVGTRFFLDLPLESGDAAVSASARDGGERNAR